MPFGGKDYSLGFVKNYKKIVLEISNNENTLIEVDKHMDSIYSHCSNKFYDTLCKYQSKIVKLENANKKILVLKTEGYISRRKAKKPYQTKYEYRKISQRM